MALTVEEAIEILRAHPELLQLRRDLQLARTTAPETLDDVLQRIEAAVQ